MALYALCASACSAPGKSDRTLRVLAWVGYDERDFLSPIREALGAEIDVKTYVGGDQMYSLFTTAPSGTYDVVVVDAEYGDQLYREGRLQTLPREAWFASDLFPVFRRGDPTRVEDAVYAAIVRWGALGLVYNTEKVTPVEVDSYAILWSEKTRGRVGIFDWYLPNMGVISLYLGNKKPYALDEGELANLGSQLKRLRPSVRSIQANTGDVISDLRNGHVWLTPGVGEWAAAVLAEDGLPFDWVIPKEGGVMWVEALAIPRDSENQVLARRFIDEVREPESLARLAWRNAYHSQVPCKTAYSHLSDSQRQLLKATSMEGLERIIDRLVMRLLPGPPPDTTERDWLKVWGAFKAG